MNQGITRPRERKRQETERMLELLCVIIRSLTHLGDKLDDIAVLNQQQADLLRRIIKERAL